MRKTLLSVLPTFALLAILAGCGDDTTAPAPTLTAQDKQSLAFFPTMVSDEKASVDFYAQIASSQAVGFANAFKPSTVPARVAAGTCTASTFDTTMVLQGMTLSMQITKADGTKFASCEDAALAYASNSGLRIKMTMAMTQSQQGSSMNMSYDMIYKPTVSTGGYTINMTMTMDMASTVGSQTTAMSINPMTAVVTAASDTATPTMTGSLTMTYNGLTISKLQFNDSGVVPSQTVDILKDGSKVATMTIDATGTATVKDLSGNVIKG